MIVRAFGTYIIRNKNPRVIQSKNLAIFPPNQLNNYLEEKAYKAMVGKGTSTMALYGSIKVNNLKSYEKKH